jgi:hypothetical protein
MEKSPLVALPVARHQRDGLRSVLVAVLAIVLYQSFVSFLWEPLKSLGCWSHAMGGLGKMGGHEDTGAYASAPPFKWEDVSHLPCLPTSQFTLRTRLGTHVLSR